MENLPQTAAELTEDGNPVTAHAHSVLPVTMAEQYPLLIMALQEVDSDVENYGAITEGTIQLVRDVLDTVSLKPAIEVAEAAAAADGEAAHG